MTFNEAIKAERLRRGLSLEDVAGQADCSKQRIVFLESGENSISLKTALKLSVILNISLDKFKDNVEVISLKAVREERERIKKEKFNIRVAKAVQNLEGCR